MSAVLFSTDERTLNNLNGRPLGQHRNHVGSGAFGDDFDVLADEFGSLFAPT